MQVDLAGRKRKRFQFLCRLYEITDGNQGKIIDFLVMGTELGFQREEIQAIVHHLLGGGLLEWHKGFRVSIAHAGVVMVEEALENQACELVSDSLPQSEIRKAEAQQQEKGSPASKPLERFPSPPGLSWSEVTIEFISDEEIRIRTRNQAKSFHYAQIGFRNEKTGKPIKNWDFFLLLAQKKEFSWDTNLPSGTRDQAKNHISQLRKRLKEMMGIASDPFANYQEVKAYRPKFELKDSRYGGVGQ